MRNKVSHCRAIFISNIKCFPNRFSNTPASSKPYFSQKRSARSFFSLTAIRSFSRPSDRKTETAWPRQLYGDAHTADAPVSYKRIQSHRPFQLHPLACSIRLRRPACHESVQGRRHADAPGHVPAAFSNMLSSAGSSVPVNRDCVRHGGSPDISSLSFVKSNDVNRRFVESYVVFSRHHF